ncbi:Mor family transcriptional regulator [Elusimicrobium posterum]|uniref:CD3324 family protein n=1 Tax=Elusimicrobium posterum TaxID=3116653 RepID=UPI003C74298B
MSYTKAQDILPQKLLKAIQKYIDGHYLYIPQKEGTKKPWGTLTNSKQRTLERNNRIFIAYQKGTCVQQLSEQYFLSDKAVYKIIAQIKYNR